MRKKPTAVPIKVQPCYRQLFQVFQPYSNEWPAARSAPSKLPTEVFQNKNEHIARTTDQQYEDICHSIVSQFETYRSQGGTLVEHVLSIGPQLLQRRGRNTTHSGTTELASTGISSGYGSSYPRDKRARRVRQEPTGTNDRHAPCAGGYTGGDQEDSPMNTPLPTGPAPASYPIPTLTLPTGSPIPVLGFGTYKVAPQDAYDAVSRALEAGYRHVDTAQMYGNESEVGAALEASGIAREDLFVTTKVDNSNHEPEHAAASIRRSLEELRTDYVDLLLVHWPLPTLYGGDVALPWPALEDAFNAGCARAIGLSNYEREHVEAVRATATVTPHVLQVESHPFFPNADLRTYAQGLGMVFEAWSPLARGRAVTDPTLVEIGAQLGVGPTQVALRWALDRGHVVFPKTLSRERMAVNFDVFSFSLEPEQTARIDALDRGEAGRTGSHPATMDRL